MSNYVYFTKFVKSQWTACTTIPVCPPLTVNASLPGYSSRVSSILARLPVSLFSQEFNCLIQACQTFKDQGVPEQIVYAVLWLNLSSCQKEKLLRGSESHSHSPRSVAVIKPVRKRTVSPRIGHNGIKTVVAMAFNNPQKRLVYNKLCRYRQRTGIEKNFFLAQQLWKDLDSRLQEEWHQIFVGTGSLQERQRLIQSDPRFFDLLEKSLDIGACCPYDPC